MAVRIVVVAGIVVAVVAFVLVPWALLHRTRSGSDDPVSLERRAILRRVFWGSLGVFAVGLGGASIWSLWPNIRSGYGTKIVAGKLNDLRATLQSEHGPIYNAEGKFYLVAYEHPEPDNYYVSRGLAVSGLMALYQKCPHLGCRVPYCPTSGWFECPCHSAKFNSAGEWRRGPAPFGMWRFPIEIAATGDVIVDTRAPLFAPPRGLDTIGQDATGACVED